MFFERDFTLNFHVTLFSRGKFTFIDSNSGFKVPEVADYKRQLIQITYETFRLVKTVLFETSDDCKSIKRIAMSSF